MPSYIPISEDAIYHKLVIQAILYRLIEKIDYVARFKG